MERKNNMDPATANALVSAAIRTIDMIDRYANSFDSQEELEAYIAGRDKAREELVAVAQELGSDDPAVEDAAEPAGDDPDHGYIPAEPEPQSDIREPSAEAHE